VSLFTTALQPTEVLTEIRVPVPAPKSGGAYVKLERKVGDFATAGVAVQLTLGKKGDIAEIGIGLTNAGPKPVRAVEAEKLLKGKTPDAATLTEAATLAGKAGNPSADRRGSVEYKQQMARVLTGRALAKALERAGGK